MDIVQNKSNTEIIKSLLAEIAKSKNEINCCLSDIQKAQGRLNFCLVLVNELIDRENNK